jgi:hypothetical protein
MNEPYHDEEVLIFREFELYKRNNPYVLSVRPDETSIRVPV